MLLLLLPPLQGAGILFIYNALPYSEVSGQLHFKKITTVAFSPLQRFPLQRQPLMSRTQNLPRDINIKGAILKEAGTLQLFRPHFYNMN